MDIINSRSEHVDTAGRFAPMQAALPNFSSASTTWATLAPGSATSLKSAGTYVLTKSGSNYTFTIESNEDVPHMMMTINTAGTVTIEDDTANNKTQARTFVNTLGNVDFTAAEMCCPTCDCSLACSASHGYPEYGSGFAVRTAGACDRRSGGALDVIGQIQCASFMDSATGDCVVGKVIGTSSTGPGCSEPSGTNDMGCSVSSTVCIKNSFTMVGTILADGNVCANNNPDGEATIQADGNVAMKNGSVQGSITATGSVYLGQNTELTWDGAGGSENQGIPAAIWLDSSW